MNDKDLNRQKNTTPQNNQVSLPEEASVLTSVLDQVSDGIYITDPERRIVFWNRAAENITGYRQEEVLGKKCADNILAHTDLAGNELCSTALCPLHKAIQSGKAPATPLTLKALNKEGERVVVEVSLAPLHGPSGEALGGIEIFRDVSAKVELEEQKARFFSSLSHELKTPLANMQGYLDLLLKKEAGEINEVQEEFLTTVYNEEQKLAGYIEELLDMGQFAGTDYSYQRNILNLSTLLENLVLGFKAEAEKKVLRFEHSIQPGLTLFGDKERLTQAFSNLVGNAIKYTETGRVTLEASLNRETDEIVITVSDSGIGIPEAEQKAIFEMFYRVEHPDARSKGGTGVGLYIVERVIRRHDGRLHLKSAPGQGSVFTVYLPGFIRENGQ
ncbi:MAG: PAS domain-containing sensor histidine kinase [Bacillota bacterium]